MIKRVLVRCPATAKLTATGQTVDEEKWEQTKLTESKVVCPHCQGTHAWTKKDAILAR